MQRLSVGAQVNGLQHTELVNGGAGEWANTTWMKRSGWVKAALMGIPAGMRVWRQQGSYGAIFSCAGWSSTSSSGTKDVQLPSLLLCSFALSDSASRVSCSVLSCCVSFPETLASSPLLEVFRQKLSESDTGSKLKPIRTVWSHEFSCVHYLNSISKRVLGHLLAPAVQSLSRGEGWRLSDSNRLPDTLLKTNYCTFSQLSHPVTQLKKEPASVTSNVNSTY